MRLLINNSASNKCNNNNYGTWVFFSLVVVIFHYLQENCKRNENGRKSGVKHKKPMRGQYYRLLFYMASINIIGLLKNELYFYQFKNNW